MNKKFLNINDVAERTSLSVSFLYKKSSSEDIPVIKIGKKLLFVAEDIDEWVLNGCTMSKQLPNFYR